jgi:AcrR family transcriptional regulator
LLHLGLLSEPVLKYTSRIYILQVVGRAHFDDTDFLRAARELMIEAGPAAVTVGSVTARLEAPTGSFYHRFASRDALVGELWLANVLGFQEGMYAAADAGDWLSAALHTAAWSRAHLDEACFLLLYHRDDFIRGEWPHSLKERVADQARRAESLVRKFAREVLGGIGTDRLARASFVLLGAPLAAVRPHLKRREPPPAVVDELIRSTYRAVVGGTGQPGRTPAARPGARR